jgi:hypothetical protein
MPLMPPHWGLVAAPNPTTGAVQLAFALPQAGPVQVIVSDLLGRTVQQSAQNLPEGENRLDLDLNHLPAGTYAVRVLAAGKGAHAESSETVTRLPKVA